MHIRVQMCVTLTGMAQAACINVTRDARDANAAVLSEAVAVLARKIKDEN